MDQVARYSEIIKRILNEHAALKPSHGDIETEVICDDAQGHYELMHSGWSGNHRIHGSAIHLDLRNGKIWIQHDGTERGVAGELMEAGIPPQHIVLAFQAPYQRKHTQFAQE